MYTMKFKSYDILSSLIAGFLIIVPCMQLLNIEYNSKLLVFYSALAYFIGYINNAISSWLEPIYYWTWLGKPSSRLLEGKSTCKVKLYEYKSIKQSLLEEAKDAGATNDKLFGIAMRKTSDSKNSRIQDFNETYAFSRSILTTSIIGGIFVLINNPSNILYYLCAFILIIIVWQRSKERGYYYAKEVLNQYYTDKNNK